MTLGGSPPCVLSDISGWSLSLVGSPPAGRRRRFRFRECRIGAVGGAGRAAARPQIEPPGTAPAPSCGVAAPVGGSVKMTRLLLARRPPSRGPSKNDIIRLRRAFSLTFRAGLYPLSGRRRADRQPSDPLAPPAGRRRRFLFGECRIGAVGGAGRAAARPQIEPPGTAPAPSYGVAAPVGGSVKMTLGVSAVLSL